MVLFKRKPVVIPPPKDITEKNAQVWYIPQTGEIFSSYEEYLARMDFYNQRKFICQITGRSCLTFFDALRSELLGAKEVDQAFPEPLKGPVLRKVQFQTVSRIDTLVDRIYDEFRADFYPGETVTVELPSGEKQQGVVREKTRYGAKTHPDGTVSEPFSRYFVSLTDKPGEVTPVDDHHITRDRKIFTKAVLRTFIKKTVTREAWNGAPWLVKSEAADKYGIDTKVPIHLQYGTKLQERKQLAAQKKALQPGSGNGAANNEPMRLPELKPAPKSHKAKPQGGVAGQEQHGKNGKQHTGAKFVHMNAPGAGFDFPVALRNNAPPPARAATPPPPPPPPPKYPIEDLQLGPRAGIVRPKMRFLCLDPPTTAKVAKGQYADRIKMESVGPLLETWVTLNVYCEIFLLDSFTFDDYVEALCVTSDDVTTQLLEEIHCGILKVLVQGEREGGKVQIELPEIDEEDDDSDEDDSMDEDESGVATPEPAPEKRATRGSLAKAEAERLAAEAAEAERQEQAAAKLVHRADELLEGYDWIERLRQRDFREGGWERILVGLLNQLSKDAPGGRHVAVCEALLGELVPAFVEPTQEGVADRYAELDPNVRVEILRFLCALTMETGAMRKYMEDCSEHMTKYRKEKIEWQRNRKQALEELKALHDQRKILLPDNMPPSPPPEAADDTKMTDAPNSPVETQATEDSDDDDGAGRRTLRRARDRAAERQRRKDEEAARKKEAELAAKLPKQSKQFLKVLKDIQHKEDYIKSCEDEIAVFDNDIREADCARVRVLGKDRFWNRYYWFERNGMPYGGLPHSSTAHAGYANGCVWVQGPDDLEREGFIDLPTEGQNEYRARFNMTVPERKRREEGSTSVYRAAEWGYYERPEELEELLNWLDPRGHNELKLRKEILAFKEKIVEGMRNRKAYLGLPDDGTNGDAATNGTAVNGTEHEEEENEGKRVSARTRQRQTSQESEGPEYRCLGWENSMALHVNGHLHVDAPPAPRSRKGARKRGSDGVGGPPAKVRRR